MSGPVRYSRKDSIAVVRMDDGKVNALGPTMQQALNEAIDQADRDNVGALVITGNERVFSGGFDLKVLTSGEVQPAIDMLRGGFELAYRLLSYPKPVVMALEIMKLRLTRSAYQQATGLAKTFFGETALAAGFIDEIVLPEMVLDRAEEAAREFAGLHQHAHAATKLRARADALAAIRAGIDGIAAELGV